MSENRMEFVYKELVFTRAGRQDIEGMALIEREFFGAYERLLSVGVITKWFNYNADMFYVVKNSENDVLAFTIIIPIKKLLYDRLKTGRTSSIVDFEISEVEEALHSEYFFIEDVCTSERYGNKKFLMASGILLTGVSKILYNLYKQGAKYVLTSPITERGKKISEKFGFILVAEEEYQGEKHSICELEINPKTYENLILRSRISRQ